MRSIRPALVAVGLAALLALGGCGQTKPTAAKTDSGSSSPADTSYPTQTRKACDVLTAEIAKSLLGSVAAAAPPVPVADSDAVLVTTCVRANAVTGLDKTRSLSLLMRVAKSKVGATANESVFSSASLPTGAQNVSGYGDHAFWNPAYGQLNILKNGNWYILSSGLIDPRKHTLPDAEKLADKIIDKL